MPSHHRVCRAGPFAATAPASCGPAAAGRGVSLVRGASAWWSCHIEHSSAQTGARRSQPACRCFEMLGRLQQMLLRILCPLAAPPRLGSPQPVETLCAAAGRRTLVDAGRWSADGGQALADGAEPLIHSPTGFSDQPMALPWEAENPSIAPEPYCSSKCPTFLDYIRATKYNAVGLQEKKAVRHTTAPSPSPSSTHRCWWWAMYIHTCVPTCCRGFLSAAVPCRWPAKDSNR